MQDHYDVVVIGAGAAGLGASARLARAAVSHLVVEAGPAIGGRARTVRADGGLPLDLGCGWLHSADRNPLAARFEALGLALDRTPPAWRRQAGNQDFSPAEQEAFQAAFAAFHQRLEAAARAGIEGPAAELLEPGCRWNPLMEAVSSYYSGAEYARISVLDYAAYQDSGVNWRVRSGYGAALAALADLRRIVTNCPVRRVRHDGPSLVLETPRGALSARAVVVTVSTAVLAMERLVFDPPLPEKAEAAAGAVLGLADKLFFEIAEPEAFPQDQHLFGRTDRAETGSYHLRPFGRPYIEAFLGGEHAQALEAAGPSAMSAFALDELSTLFGEGVRDRLRPLAATAWAQEPWIWGAYSHCLPGQAHARARLAAPVASRIFFAGEATSAAAYSTAHGAWMTGERAADEALAALA